MTHESQHATQDTSLLRLELSDDVRQFVENIEQSGFDRDESTYTFTDSDFIDHTWLPLDLAALVATNDSSVKKIDVSYAKDAGELRQNVAVVLYLTNGERIALTKDSSDPADSEFEFTYTDSNDSLQPIARGDVARLMTSLLFPTMQRSEATMSQLLAANGSGNELDPTDPILSRYILQLLPQRADSWQREESVELAIEDDNNSLRAVRTTSSENDGTASVTFTQTDTENGTHASFEGAITQNLDGRNIDVTYERKDPTVEEQASAEEQPHIYDFMQAVIKLANKALSSSVKPALSYEVEAQRILRTESIKKSI